MRPDDGSAQLDRPPAEHVPAGEQPGAAEPVPAGEGAARRGEPADPVDGGAPPSEPPTAEILTPAPVDELVTRVAAVEAVLGELTRRLADEANRAAARERIIDRQHEEIARLRSLERSGLLRPVVTDLCRLRNDLLRQAATVPAEMTGSKVADLLASFGDEVEQALERCGVAVAPREPGAPFTAGRQQVAAIVDTEDPDRDGTVAAVVQDGYVEIDGETVVLPARITVHRLTQQTKETTG